MSTDARAAAPVRRPRLAVLLGDPNGIGPEIAVKLLARKDLAADVDVAIFTDPTRPADRWRSRRYVHDRCLRIPRLRSRPSVYKWDRHTRRTSAFQS